MKKIPLTQGQFALVDDEDFEWLNQWKWRCQNAIKTNYVVRHTTRNSGLRQTVRMHRLIMGLDNADKCQVDHINGNGLDNRKQNLRVCGIQQNSFNQSIPSNNTSGHKGVCWVKRDKRWRAQVKVSGRRVYLGYFVDKVDAAVAYNKYVKENFGEFAKLNIIPEEKQ